MQLELLCHGKHFMVKFLDTQHIAVKSLKSEHNSQTVEKDLQKTQLKSQNISDPDKTSSWSCLIWVYTVCFGLSVNK